MKIIYNTIVDDVDAAIDAARFEGKTIKHIELSRLEFKEFSGRAGVGFRVSMPVTVKHRNITLRCVTPENKAKGSDYF